MFGIDKFDGKIDFSLWQMKMHAVLVQQGLHKAIKGKRALPATMSESNKDELLEKAYSALVLCLSDGVLQKVAGEQTASELWQKLENLYVDKSLENRLYLKKKLLNLKMQEGTSISDHLDAFNKVIMDLRSIDTGFKDEDHAIIFTSSLTPPYEQHFDSVMLGRESLSMEDVEIALNSMELETEMMLKNDNKALYQDQERDKLKASVVRSVVGEDINETLFKA